MPVEGSLTSTGLAAPLCFPVKLTQRETEVEELVHVGEVDLYHRY